MNNFRKGDRVKCIDLDCVYDNRLNKRAVYEVEFVDDLYVILKGVLGLWAYSRFKLITVRGSSRLLRKASEHIYKNGFELGCCYDVIRRLAKVHKLNLLDTLQTYKELFPASESYRGMSPAQFNEQVVMELLLCAAIIDHEKK